MSNIKRFVTITAVVGMILILGGIACGFHRIAPEPGNDAVIIRKPMFFGAGGVDTNPVRNTTRWVAPTTSAQMINIQPMQFPIKFDDLFTADGVPLDFEASIRVRITDAVRIVRDYGSEHWFATNVEQPFRELMRDEVKKRQMSVVVFGDGRLAAGGESLDDAVNRLAKTMADGAPWEVQNVALGRANPPEGIAGQRAETARQILRQETEKEAKKAEDERKAKEDSRAAADRAYNEKIGIDVQANVELEKLRIIAGACAKGGCNVFLGGGVVPTLSVK